jgi:probable phosphoglycerate mutase
VSTLIFLTRHGQTDWGRGDRFSGLSDIALNETGKFQARALGKRVKNLQLVVKDNTLAEPEVMMREGQGLNKITAVYCSPLKRTLETAQIVADLLKLPVKEISQFRELNYGAWEGLSRDEILLKYPKEWEVWSQDPAQNAPSGGETGIALLARVRPALEQLIANHPNETILMVAHKTVNRLLICSLLNIPLKSYRWAIGQNESCLNILNFVSGDIVSLIRLNDISHYEEGKHLH